MTPFRHSVNRGTKRQKDEKTKKRKDKKTKRQKDKKTKRQKDKKTKKTKRQKDKKQIDREGYPGRIGDIKGDIKERSVSDIERG